MRRLPAGLVANGHAKTISVSHGKQIIRCPGIGLAPIPTVGRFQDSPTIAYGDVILSCENRAGERIVCPQVWRSPIHAIPGSDNGLIAGDTNSYVTVRNAENAAQRSAKSFRLRCPIHQVARTQRRVTTRDEGVPAKVYR